MFSEQGLQLNEIRYRHKNQMNAGKEKTFESRNFHFSSKAFIHDTLFLQKLFKCLIRAVFYPLDTVD